MIDLSDRYMMTHFRFCDNVIQKKELLEFAELLKQTGRHFRFFYELRATIKPIEIVRLWKVGLHSVQIGIEGLSTAYLRRMNKGTTAIQNLQIMKICTELGIFNIANLITHFPGTTENEIKEQIDCIRDYAVIFQPLFLSEFALHRGTAVEQLPEKFGISDISNSSILREAMPPAVWNRLELFWLDWVQDNSNDVRWREIYTAREQWVKRHDELKATKHLDCELYIPKALTYYDGREFMQIIDRRYDSKTYRLNKTGRDIYLFCSEIKTADQITKKFGEFPYKWMDFFLDRKLMFREKKKYLSVACAVTPELAARRIELHYKKKKSNG